MSHLVRAALLLVLAGMGFLLTRTVVMTSVTVPFLRTNSSDNPRQWATLPVRNQPSDACGDCHAPIQASWEGAAHLNVTCQDCHGPAQEHVAAANAGHQTAFPLPDPGDLCLICHARLTARPRAFPQVDPATHAPSVLGAAAWCTTCHNAHDPGIPPEIPHELEERSECLTCHGQDEWKPVPPDHVGRTSGECRQCHVIKKGITGEGAR